MSIRPGLAPGATQGRVAGQATPPMIVHGAHQRAGAPGRRLARRPLVSGRSLSRWAAQGQGHDLSFRRRFRRCLRRPGPGAPASAAPWDGPALAIAVVFDPGLAPGLHHTQPALADGWHVMAISARTPAFPVCRRCGLDLAVPHELNLCRHLRLVGRGHNCPKLSPVVQWARPEVSDIQASGDVGQSCTWQRWPAVALGLKHHSRRAVAVQNGRDDASVQIAEAVVMLGPRHERRCHNPIARVAAELQSLRVAWPAAEAGQARIQPFLNAEAMADPTGSHKVSVVSHVAATSGQAPRSRAAQAHHATGPATYLGTCVGDPVRADALRSNADRAALARPGPLPSGPHWAAGEGGRRIPAGTLAG